MVNQKPSFLSVLRPNVDFYVQAALIPLPLRLCWTKRGSHANAEAGRKQKEEGKKGGEADWRQWSGTDGVREKAEENEQWKYKSLNQKNKKFIRIWQREGRR